MQRALVTVTHLVVLGLVVFGQACAPGAATPTPTAGSRAGVSAPAASPGHAAVLSPGACVPIRVVVLRDRSLSTIETITPSITAEHLERLLGLVGRCGGELAFGDICAMSFKPLVRVRVDQPPLPPARQFSNDPFEQRRLNDAFAARLARSRTEVQAWKDATARRFEAFRASAAPVVGAPASCRKSDVAGALRRALLFHQEELVGWTHVPRRIVVLASDAQHDQGPWDVVIPEDIELLLVNGVGSRGHLADLPARLFENLDPALLWLEHYTGRPPAP